jgi:L-ascorbate metabolism protein UlaG (beta-lactamase superfamily)
MNIYSMKLFFISILIATVLAGLYLYVQLSREFGRNPASGQVYRNEIPTAEQTGNFSYQNMLREMVFPSSKRRKPAQPIPNQANDLKRLPAEQASIVWFGHSSYLLNLKGFHLLVDPVFSGHSAPLPFLVNSFAGTDAYLVDDLPAIDVLLITHDHYDHLDRETVLGLKNRVKQVVTMAGVGEHLRFWGYPAERITELNWHESTVIQGHTVTATPARHFSGRSLARNQTLWGSFVIKNAEHALYIGGDSGYGPHFKAIGERYGPFDWAMLESGQYNENWANIHMMPEQTVQAAQDLKARVLFPVHWGKFVLSLHDWDEPIMRVTAESKRVGQTMVTPMVGEVVSLTQPKTQMWWKRMEQAQNTLSSEMIQSKL